MNIQMMKNLATDEEDAGRAMQNLEIIVGVVNRNLVSGNAKLEHVHLDSRDLRQANLEGANLAIGNMGSANFSRANLKNADIYGSFLNMANLEEANLEGANLRGAILTNAEPDPDNIGVPTFVDPSLKRAPPTIWANSASFQFAPVLFAPSRKLLQWGSSGESATENVLGSTRKLAQIREFSSL